MLNNKNLPQPVSSLKSLGPQSLDKSHFHTTGIHFFDTAHWNSWGLQTVFGHCCGLSSDPSLQSLWESQSQLCGMQVLLSQRKLLPEHLKCSQAPPGSSDSSEPSEHWFSPSQTFSSGMQRKSDRHLKCFGGHKDGVVLFSWMQKLPDSLKPSLHAQTADVEDSKHNDVQANFVHLFSPAIKTEHIVANIKTDPHQYLSCLMYNKISHKQTLSVPQFLSA